MVGQGGEHCCWRRFRNGVETGVSGVSGLANCTLDRKREREKKMARCVWRFSCGSCGKPVTANQAGVFYKVWVHCKCASISASHYATLQDSEGGWCCPTCEHSGYHLLIVLLSLSVKNWCLSLICQQCLLQTHHYQLRLPPVPAVSPSFIQTVEVFYLRWMNFAAWL